MIENFDQGGLVADHRLSHAKKHGGNTMIESFWKHFNKAIVDEVDVNANRTNNNVYSFK